MSVSNGLILKHFFKSKLAKLKPLVLPTIIFFATLFFLSIMGYFVYSDCSATMDPWGCGFANNLMTIVFFIFTLVIAFIFYLAILVLFDGLTTIKNWLRNNWSDAKKIAEAEKEKQKKEEI